MLKPRRVACACLSIAAFVLCAGTAHAYNPINPLKAGETVVLDGKHLSIQDVVDVARYGAKVQLADSARQKSLNAYYLLLEGARENMPIYFFNRGTGSGRQTPIFSGDPLSNTVDSSSPTCPTSQVQCSNRQF